MFFIICANAKHIAVYACAWTLESQVYDGPDCRRTDILFDVYTYSVLCCSSLFCSVVFCSILGCVLPLQDVALCQGPPTFSVLCCPCPYSTLLPHSVISQTMLWFKTHLLMSATPSMSFLYRIHKMCVDQRSDMLSFVCLALYVLTRRPFVVAVDPNFT